MSFEIKRLGFLTDKDPGFAEQVAMLPDSVDKCLDCGCAAGRRQPAAVGTVLIADESDDEPRAIFSVLCPACSASNSRDQVVMTWAKGLIEMYGGTEIPDLHPAGRA